MSLSSAMDHAADVIALTTVFLARDGVLLTPPLAHSALAGGLRLKAALEVAVRDHRAL